MSLAEKNVLLICDDSALSQKISDALKSKVKLLVSIASPSEAHTRCEQVKFDAFVTRTKAPFMDDPKGPFIWAQTQKQFKAAPWIILGKDVEDEQVIVNYNFVKFVADSADVSALTTVLEGTFSTGAQGKGKPGIDVNFLNPLVGAVINVIETMAQIKLERQNPVIKKSGDPAFAPIGISGIIAMNSNRFLGSLSISYEESLIKKIYENMMGSPVTEINDDIKDCVSELTNIIFGNAKRDLNALGHTISPALPSVITGANHEIRHSISGVVLCIPFKTPHGSLIVECVTSSRD